MGRSNLGDIAGGCCVGWRSGGAGTEDCMH